ncbi:MAG: PIN domain-containing protein [Gammaproteobacteria bacterium RIFCSPHIGHO2_12_FULL_41_20]|nr:MAG: PIN domain-containing protein [Gammaproteobacteria bacterium RIFCSPHIGHO2_12_FULL_41_20]
MKKYLVDTCGWIEWLINGKMVAHFEPYLKNVNQLIVPTLVQYELYKWICREKNQDAALEIIGVTEKATIVPLDTHLALFAADVAKQYQLAMADAIIYATAQKYDIELITSDEHFLKLPQVKFFNKKS